MCDPGRGEDEEEGGVAIKFSDADRHGKSISVPCSFTFRLDKGQALEGGLAADGRGIMPQTLEANGEATLSCRLETRAIGKVEEKTILGRAIDWH